MTPHEAPIEAPSAPHEAPIEAPSAPHEAPYEAPYLPLMKGTESFPVSITAAVPVEARTEQYNQMKRQRDDLLRQRQLEEEREREARKLEEERAARQRVFDDLARQFARERERAARKRRADSTGAASKRARTRYYHGAEDEFFTVMPPWRRQTRRPVCFDHDPYNGIFCHDLWCIKEHLDTRDVVKERRYAAAMRSYYGR